MAPTRRARANAAPAYPPSPPSEEDEYRPQNPNMASSGRHNPYQRAGSQGAAATMAGGAIPLQRGSACLSCRKRKMKCDGMRPICQQCSRANRSADCEYDDGKTKTRTQLLQEKIHRLEYRLHQLEGTAPSEGNVTANAPFAQSPTPFIGQSGLQAFDFNIIPDKSTTDFDFDFGTAASSSATRVYDQQLMKRLIDVASGADPAAGDTSWDAIDTPVHPKDVGNHSDWQEDGLPPRLRQQLLEIVLPHVSRLGVDLHLPTFLQTLNLPPTHAMRPHPCLLYALYLHACAMSPPDHYLHSHQAKFARKCRDAISASLEFSDRLVDNLRAQCLIATYYFAVGRPLDGYSFICSSARLAVGCELNRIVSPILRPQPVTDMATIDYGHIPHVGLGIGLPNLAATAAASSSSGATPLLDNEGKLDVFYGIAALNLTHPRKISLGFGTGLLPASSFAYDNQVLYTPEPGRHLGGTSYSLVGGATTRPAAQNKPNPILEPARNARELGERILLFWRIFNMDRFWSVACGLQPALSEDEIITVWPRNMEDYQSGNVNDNEYSSVRSLGVRQPVASTRPDATATLVSKAITLFERSARLAGSLSAAQPPTEAFWVAFRLMEDSIAQLTSCIPSYKRRVIGAFETMMGQNNGKMSHPGSHGPSPTGSTRSDSPTNNNSQGNYAVPQHNLGFAPLSSSMPSGSTSAFGTSGHIEIDETLVLVHILLCSASVQLHNIFAKEDENSYQKVFAAARTGAAIIAEVAETMHGEHYDVMLGPCLTLLADVLVREAVRGGPAVMNSLEPELEAVLFVLKAIGANSPFISRQAALVSAAKDALIARHERASEQGQRHAQQHQIQVPTVLSMTLPPNPMLPFGTGAV